jgi:hypothetical protein
VSFGNRQARVRPGDVAGLDAPPAQGGRVDDPPAVVARRDRERHGVAAAHRHPHVQPGACRCRAAHRAGQQIDFHR